MAQSAAMKTFWSGRILARAAEAIEEGHEAFGVGEFVVLEGDEAALWPGFELGDAGGEAGELDFDDAEEVAGFGRQGAEAVDHFGGEAIDVGAALHLVEAAVEGHADVEIRHIVLGDEDGDFDGDLRAEGFGGGFDALCAGLGLEDRLFEHRLVEFEADLLDMAGLFVAEQVAGAAHDRDRGWRAGSRRRGYRAR